MAKRIIFGLLTALLALALVGCGGGDDKPAGNEKPAASSNAPATPPEEAILGIAEFSIFGNSEHDTGMSDSDKQKIHDQVVSPSIEGFKGLYFNDENAEILAERYFAHLKDNMQISTKIIDNDPAHPIVEVSATPLDAALVQEYMATSEALAEVQGALQQLTEAGIELETLRENEEFQTQAMAYMEQYVDGIPLSAEGVKTFEVKCKLENGVWVPEDPAALAKFLTSQK